MTKPTSETHAYQQMLDRIKSTLHKVDAEHLEKAFEQAKQTAVQLGELTQEEAGLVASYLRRDLHDAAKYMKDTGSELGDWMKFDVKLVEQRLWDSFKQVADKTDVELLELKYTLPRGPAFHAGELTALSSLQCENCGEIIHFHKVSHIPPCPQCQHSRFLRV